MLPSQKTEYWDFRIIRIMDTKNKFLRILTEKKAFILFLIIHLLVFVGVALIRKVLPADSLEGIWWGSLHDFGSPKHPPLAAWLTYLAFLPFKSDFCVYLMSQLFIIGGFIYTYKLAKYFLDENKAVLSVMLLEGCWIYSYITGYYGFNPDVVLLLILPAITYYFYKCMLNNKGVDWIKLGIWFGLGCLDKYQTCLLVIAMAIWAFVFNKKTFKNKYFYISVLIAFLIFLPHILWLIKYDFFPLLYYDNELNVINGYNHLTSPLMFLSMQIVMIIGTLFIYSVSRFEFKEPITLAKTFDKKQAWFLILLCFVPHLIHTLIGIYFGSDIRPRWGYVNWYMLGIMLFYFFPIEINKERFKFISKLVYFVMIIVFLSMGILFTVEKNYRSRYPVDNVLNDLKTQWAMQYEEPLKYIGGDTEWTFPLSVYGGVTNVMDTFSYKNPWIDEDDLKKSGIMIIDRRACNILDYIKSLCPYLPEDYPIRNMKKYEFTIHNALGMPKNYTIYYYIVPPQK